MTAQILLVFEKWRFLDIKKLDKKTLRTSISQPYSGLLSGYIKVWQIWISSLTAQIFLVFEKLRFL